MLLASGDKLRHELTVTTADLSSKLQAAEAARAAAAAEAESSRLGLGSMSQQMAKTVAELEREREVAQEMKTRVVQLNQSFMITGQRSRISHCCASCASTSTSNDLAYDL